MNITKADLAQNLADKFNLSKNDARILVDNFFACIVDALAQGQDVKLSGFGSFNLRDKNARPGRNPKTGEVVEVSKRRVVTFKQGQVLNDAMQLSVE